MTGWNFVVHILDLEEFTDDLVNALYEAGCDDGTLSSSNLRSQIRFDRESASLQDAIASAIADVEKTGLKVDRVEIEKEDFAMLVQS